MSWVENEKMLCKRFNEVELILMDEIKARGHKWTYDKIRIDGGAGNLDRGMFRIYKSYNYNNEDKIEVVYIYLPYENPQGLPEFEHRGCGFDFSNVKELVDALQLYIR